MRIFVINSILMWRNILKSFMKSSEIQRHIFMDETISFIFQISHDDEFRDSSPYKPLYLAQMPIIMIPISFHPGGLSSKVGTCVWVIQLVMLPLVSCLGQFYLKNPPKLKTSPSLVCWIQPTQFHPWQRMILFLMSVTCPWRQPADQSPKTQTNLLLLIWHGVHPRASFVRLMPAPLLMWLSALFISRWKLELLCRGLRTDLLCRGLRTDMAQWGSGTHGFRSRSSGLCTVSKRRSCATNGKIP